MARLLQYPRQDLKGCRFGRLTVLSFVEYIEDGKGRRHDVWFCRCQCGVEKKIKGQLLRIRQRGTKSCGCLLEENYVRMKDVCINRNVKDSGVAEFNTFYNAYVQRAHKKKYTFSLSKEEFRKITSADCHYCGAPPRESKAKAKYNGRYLFNGIDRVDNGYGYELNNVRPCCEICNKAKRDLTLEDFEAWITQLTLFRLAQLS